MVTRNYKAVVQIAGTVAASLPSSARKASAELERLTTAQRIDRLEGNRLKSELRSLRKGTDDYKTALAQQAAIRTRTAERSVRIRELGEASQQSTGILGRFGAGLRSIGPYGAAAGAGIGLATAAITFLVRWMNRAADEARQLNRTGVVFDVDTELLYRSGEALRTVTGDLRSAEQQAASLASGAQQLRQAQMGLIPGFGEMALGASRAGVAIESIASGDYRRVVADIRQANERGIGTDQIVAGLRRIPGYNDEVIKSLLQLATNEELAQRAAENFATVSPPSPEQIQRLQEWDDALGDIRSSFRQARQGAEGELAPTLTKIAANLGFLDDVMSASARQLASWVEGPINSWNRLMLAGEFVSAQTEASTAKARAAWWGVGIAVTAVTGNVLGKLEKLVAGFASVSEIVKDATGGVIDFTGASGHALSSIRELRSGVQGANDEAEARFNEARADARQANMRIRETLRRDQELAGHRQPAVQAAPATAMDFPVAEQDQTPRPPAAEQPTPVERPSRATAPAPPVAEPAQAPHPPAAVAAQPRIVEQHNTYIIEGSADPDAVLRAAEESTLRMIRELPDGL